MARIHRVLLLIAIHWLQRAGTEPPRFLSKGGMYKVVVGDTLELPCTVENLGTHVLLWRRDNLILTAAKLMVVRDPRFSLQGDYDLHISNVSVKDGGDYVCQIADLSAQDQVHKVTVLVVTSAHSNSEPIQSCPLPTTEFIPPTAPPVIHSTVANGQLTVRKGGSVTLNCEATGNPEPTVLWSKKDSGHLYKPGMTVTLERVDRHHAGVYQCTANNGVGPPAVVDLRLDVLHPPEIEVDQGWVNAAEGSLVKLVCIVYGNPTPNMLWYQEGALVVSTRRFSTDTMANRHVLTIKPVLGSDFGNFSCVAENPLGRSKHTIQLTGKPGKLRMVSSPYSSSTHSYHLKWQVDSASPLEECRVIYRRVMINDSHQQVGAWHEMTFRPPASVGRSSLGLHITGLEPASVFQAQAQVRNRYGWSELSDPHQFYTRGTDHELFEQRRTAVVTVWGHSPLGGDLLDYRVLEPETSRVTKPQLRMVFGVRPRQLAMYKHCRRFGHIAVGHPQGETITVTEFDSILGHRIWVKFCDCDRLALRMAYCNVAETSAMFVHSQLTRSNPEDLEFVSDSDDRGSLSMKKKKILI